MMKENKKEEIESELRARTQELKESKEQIQLLLDSTGEAIYGLDNDGNCNFANAACLRILRYKEASQLIGENMHDLIHHTKQDGTPYPIEECRIYQAFREGKGTHVEDEVLWRKDGQPIAVLEVAGHDHDEVDQSPDSEAAESEQLQNARADLSHVEAVDPEGSQEKAEQDRRDESLRTRVAGRIHRARIHHVAGSIHFIHPLWITSF